MAGLGDSFMLPHDGERRNPEDSREGAKNAKEKACDGFSVPSLEKFSSATEFRHLCVLRVLRVRDIFASFGECTRVVVTATDAAWCRACHRDGRRPRRREKRYCRFIFFAVAPVVRVVVALALWACADFVNRRIRFRPLTQPALACGHRVPCVSDVDRSSLRCR